MMSEGRGGALKPLLFRHVSFDGRGSLFRIDYIGNGIPRPFRLTFGQHPLALAGVVLLGILGFVAIGTLFSAISSRTSMGDTLLPILVFPLMIPVIIFGVTATAALFAGLPVAEVDGNLRMLGAFAAVALFTGAWLFRFVVEE